MPRPFRYLAIALLAGSSLLAADAVEAAREQLRTLHADAAIQLLRDAIAKDPATPDANLLLTEVLLHQERFDEADQVINAALAANAGSADLHRVRGDLIFREGQIFEAEKEYKAAYKIDPKNARALYGIARTFDAACLRRKAEGLIRAAHQLAPQDRVIQAAFNRLERNSTAAIAQWQTALDALHEPESPLARQLTRRIAIAKALGGKPEFDLAGTYAHYQIPLTRLMNGTRSYGLALPVSIGGVKTELQLDTGAGGILISGAFAARAGVERIADVEIGGVGNDPPRKGWIGYAEKIQIGNLEFHNCIVDVLDRGSGIDAAGLIGTNILRRFLVKLNFKERRLDLDPLPGPEWDGSTPVDRYLGPELKDYSQVLEFGHDLLIPTRISEDKDSDPTPGVFLIDTGSSFSQVSNRLAGEVTKVHESEYVRVKGLNGKVRKVYQASQLILQFAAFRQSNLDLISFDLSNISRGAGTDVMGILGLPILLLFQSITLDYRDGLVRFDFNAK